MPDARATPDAKDRVFVALDTPEVARATRLTEALRGDGRKMSLASYVSVKRETTGN